MFALASLKDKLHLGNLQASFGDKTASLINIETGKKECLCLKTFSRHARRKPDSVRDSKRRKSGKRSGIAQLLDYAGAENRSLIWAWRSRRSRSC